MARKVTTTPAPDLLEGYDPNDPASVAAVEAKIRTYVKLGFLKMNRAQEPFIRVKNNRGRTPRTRLFESGNQVGKCVSVATLIDTPNGSTTVGVLFQSGVPFDVYAWDGENRVVARASAPFKKTGLHQCYRITMSDGRWVEAADNHRMLCSDGVYRTAVELHDAFVLESLRISSGSMPRLESSSSLPRSSSVRGLSVHASGAICFPKTPSGFLESCSRGLRRCGALLRSVAGIGQVSFPSPGDARSRNDGATSGKGETCTRCNDSLCSASLHPSSWYVLLQIAGRFAAWIGQAASRAFQSPPESNQFSQQLCAAEAPLPRSFCESLDGPLRLGNALASSNPPLVGNYIEYITPIAELQEVYDFEVAVHHNYFAGGLIHHNTSIGVAEDIAHAMGFRPWLDKNDPDYKVPIQVPNQGLVGCEVAGQTLSQRIEPEFMQLIPQYCGVTTTRYSDGSLKSLTLANDFNGKPCGSTIHFRSYVQQADSFEGVVLAWIHFDEPPPKEILTAATRGLMSTNGPSWYTMTPLKEAYIYDLLSLHAYNNGGNDQEIAVFRGSTWDNCQDWCRDCDCTVPQNNPDLLAPGEVRPVDNCPKCGRIMGFLPRAGIENYLKKITDPDEREAREEGKWKHLSGLIYKELDRETHLYEDFAIPGDWMRIEAVDPHDARPTNWLFGAVSPEDIIINGRPANRIYWYAYLLPTGNIHDIATKVKVKRAEHNYREPAMVILDAKFGSKSIKTSEHETTWEEELNKAGINKIILSHSAPGEVALGHKRVKEYLAPHYSAKRGIAFPGMMWAREACKGDKGPIQCMFNYQWKEGTDKPEEAYKDFCDPPRYAALEQPTYKAPQPEIDQELARMLLDKENMLSNKESTLYHGLAMRS